MSLLFSPFTIRTVNLKNHLAMSPMCQYSATDGFANDWHLIHYGSRAIGNVGLILQEATAVTPEGRISSGDLGLWDDAQIGPLRRIQDFLQSHGCVFGIQLAHAGRKASTKIAWEGDGPVSEEEGGWIPVAPSAIPFDNGYPVPHALTGDEIIRIEDAFAAAAERAVKAGYRVIEIHAAHGYLIHEFLSPLSNLRTDEYGGSFLNRIRILTEIIKKVRMRIPAGYPLFVRISATDYAEGGWDPEQSIALAQEIKKLEVDLIDVSSGGLLPHVRIPADFGYQLKFAQRIKEIAGIMTATVGMITTPEQAESILFNDQADLILLGRELLRNPYFGLTQAPHLHSEVKWPVQYVRAKP